MQKTALITGVTGQDGAYLAELLLKKGYEVHGIKRRSSLFNTDRIDHLYQDPHVDGRHFTLHYGDLTDSTSLVRIIQQVQPDEIYNLAAMSHVAVSFETPEYTANADGIGTLRILEAIRIHMPAVRRISSYCLPRNLRKKSQADIDELAAAGLTMAYVGAESGDDAVLAAVSKGETFDTTCEALDKLGVAGITRSVMILNGLGGKALDRKSVV